MKFYTYVHVTSCKNDGLGGYLIIVTLGYISIGSVNKTRSYAIQAMHIQSYTIPSTYCQMITHFITPD